MVLNNWTSTCEKMILDTDLTPFTTIKSKWMIDLNIKHKAISEITQLRMKDMPQTGIL